MNDEDRINILLVDDQPAKLLAYEAMLADLGENLISAGSGTEALDHLLRSDIAVVLMDVSMPDLDGFELTRIIRQHPRFGHTAIIFVSAIHLTNLDQLKGYEVGAVDYVSVPVVPEILRAKVSVFAELHRKRLEAERFSRELEARVADRTAELRASTTRLRASEERFRIMAEMIPSIIWTATADGTITYANRRWREYCGDAGMGDRVHWPEQLVHPDDLEKSAGAMTANPAAAKPFELEVRLRRHDGAYRWFEARAEPRYAEDGAVLGWFGIMTDIDDRMRMADRLRDADRRKDEFLATLAHELRNPLAPIGNAITILRTLGKPDAQLDWCYGVIERQTAQLARLVDDLLDVSRITRGKITLQKEPVDLAGIVTNALEMSRSLIDSRHHVLVVSLPPDPCIVDGDAMRLAQIVANLVNNAAKYQDKGGHIRLCVERVGDDALISVQDKGIGIPPERLPTLFEMFSQGTETLDRSNGGLGIGLALVRTLVHLHGGTVEAMSAGIGQGSEFLVRLPCASATRSPVVLPPEPNLAAAPATALEILVVDDNRDAADVLTTLLRTWGHHVEMAHDGPTALDLAISRRPSLILLDIGLPGMNGYEVCRRIRDHGLTEPLIVALTGYGQDRDRRRSMESGFDSHAVKPMGSRALRELIESITTGEFQKARAEAMATADESTD